MAELRRPPQSDEATSAFGVEIEVVAVARSRPLRLSSPPGVFSIPPLLLLFLAFDAAPPPPPAIAPSPSPSSSSLFFLFLAAYIAEKEYPSLDPPLHPWHDEHPFFDGSFGRPHLWHTHAAPAPTDDDGGPMRAGRRASASVAAAGDLFPPLPPSVPQDRTLWHRGLPVVILTMVATTTTPPSSRPSPLPRRRRLYRTPPKGTPRRRCQCPTLTWTGAPRTATADVGPSRPPSPPYRSANAIGRWAEEDPGGTTPDDGRDGRGIGGMI